MNTELFNKIRDQYGHYASWAVWSAPGVTATSNVGDLSIFDLEKHPQVVSELNPGVVLCGLNISRPMTRSLGNFHDPHPRSKDYKLRYALMGTSWYGAYMTDLFKDFEEKASGNVAKYVKENPDFLEANLAVFLEELDILPVEKLTIVALGVQVYEYLIKSLNGFRILKVPHFAHYIKKEDYRDMLTKAMERD